MTSQYCTHFSETSKRFVQWIVPGSYQCRLPVPYSECPHRGTRASNPGRFRFKVEAQHKPQPGDERSMTRYPSCVDRDEIIRVLRAFEAAGLEYVLIGATA